MNCGRAFAQSWNLQVHLENVHNKICKIAAIYDRPENNFPETTINQSTSADVSPIHDYISKDDITQATQLIHQCKYCDKSFKMKIRLNVHIRQKHKHKCNYCDERFEMEHQAAEHSLTHLEDSKENANDKPSETNADDFSDESEKESSKTEFEKEFSDETETESSEVSEEEAKPYKCDKCNKSYRMSFHLKMHEKTHSEGNDQSEESENTEDDEDTQTSELFDIEKQDVKPDPETRPFQFQCDYCSKKFKLKIHLKVHTRIHTGEREYYRAIDTFLKFSSEFHRLKN